jgi:RNA polymerase sigma-70 factor (ECF subfamily)
LIVLLEEATKMNSQKVFDALLIMEYRSGKKRALSLLIDRYHQRLCRHSFWYTRDMNASKDIVQDSWQVILNKLDGLHDPNSFGSWAMRIVTRKSLDYLKKHKHHSESLKALQQEVVDVESQDRKESELIKLNQAIRELHQDQQLVLRLFYTQEYSLKEISDILELPVGTVKSRLYNAREKLKTILKYKS